MSRRAMLWVLGGLLGIVLTAGITWATSKLTSEHIGLSSQPPSSMRSLAPRTLPPAETRTTTRTTTSPARTTGTPLTATTTTSHIYSTQTTSSEDGGGSSRGSQRSGHEPDD